jgi:hypothetical protein
VEQASAELRKATFAVEVVEIVEVVVVASKFEIVSELAETDLGSESPEGAEKTMVAFGWGFAVFVEVVIEAIGQVVQAVLIFDFDWTRATDSKIDSVEVDLLEIGIDSVAVDLAEVDFVEFGSVVYFVY